jgi:transcriptional regulator with XRE-family HTH domain
MTQAALASRLYLARTSFSRLENGQRAVTVPELAAIAAVLGVDLAYLAVPNESSTTMSTIVKRPVAAQDSRVNWAEIPVRWQVLWTIVVAIFSDSFKKTKIAVGNGLISEAEQHWEGMARAHHLSLGRLDVARYSTAVRDPASRHGLKYAG